MNMVRRVLLRVAFWRDYFWRGERELMELPKYVNASTFALDIGGNIGVYTYHLNRLARNVITFEPTPEYAQSIEDLSLPKVRVERVALSDQVGEADLRVPRSSGGEDGGMASIETDAVPDTIVARKIQVPLRRLDDYGFEDVGFIKVDVEGHEEKVLRGAWETICQCRPTLLIEIEERHNPGGLQRINAVLKKIGYECFFFESGIKRHITEFEVACLRSQASTIKEKHTANRRSSPYINNFLFVAAEDCKA